MYLGICTVYIYVTTKKEKEVTNLEGSRCHVRDWREEKQENYEIML